MEFEDILGNPGFYLLAGGAIAATLIGWKMSKSFGASFPLWQVLIVMVVEVIAAAFFAAQGD